MGVALTLADFPSRLGGEPLVSDWIEVSQAMIDEFADAIRDPQWIHVDPERAARESPFRDATGAGRTVAHGFLTLSLLSHLIENAIDFVDRRAGINVGFNRVRFTAPVLMGSRIRGRFVLLDLQPIAGGLQLTWEVTIESEGTTRPALVAEWLTRALTA